MTNSDDILGANSKLLLRRKTEERRSSQPVSLNSFCGEFAKRSCAKCGVDFEYAVIRISGIPQPKYCPECTEELFPAPVNRFVKSKQDIMREKWKLMCPWRYRTIQEDGETDITMLPQEKLKEVLATAEDMSHPAAARYKQYKREVEKGNPDYAIISYNYKDISDLPSWDGLRWVKKQRSVPFRATKDDVLAPAAPGSSGIYEEAPKLKISHVFSDYVEGEVRGDEVRSILNGPTVVKVAFTFSQIIPDYPYTL